MGIEMQNRTAWATMGLKTIVASALVVFAAAACTPAVENKQKQVDLAAQIALADRSSDDRARDAARRPAEVLTFFGVKPGMTVIDLIAAGGWYTEVLAAAVGPEGKVYAQNPKVALEFRDGAADKEMTARLANNRLTNVVRLDREMNDLGIEPGSIDFVLTALNFHDVYNESPDQAQAMLALIYRTLKPGGVLGLVDHNGAPGGDNKNLHRMHKALAIDAALDAGFEIEQSDVLANPDDDYSTHVFAEETRGKTDRFVLKLTKPKN